MITYKKFLIITIIISLIITGCGLSKPGNSFLARSTDQVSYISWTETDNKLVGQLQIADYENGKIKSENHPFNGIKQGSNISITFSASLWVDGWGGQTWTGMLTRDSLTLNYPTTNGSIGTITMKPGKVDDFNKAINEFNKKAQEASDRENYKIQQEKAKINLKASLVQLDSETSRLSKISYIDILKNYETDWNNIQNHYNKLLRDSSVRPFGDYQLSVVDYDLSQMEYDLSCFEYNDGSIKNKNDEVLGCSSRIDKYIITLQNSFQEYQKYGSPGGEYNSDNISQAINNAQKQIEISKNDMTNAQKQVDDYNNKAKQLFQTAKNYVPGLRVINY